MTRSHSPLLPSRLSSLKKRHLSLLLLHPPSKKETPSLYPSLLLPLPRLRWMSTTPRLPLHQRASPPTPPSFGPQSSPVAFLNLPRSLPPRPSTKKASSCGGLSTLPHPSLSTPLRLRRLSAPTRWRRVLNTKDWPSPCGWSERAWWGARGSAVRLSSRSMRTWRRGRKKRGLSMGRGGMDWAERRHEI
jgi:hypothetical protein